CHDRHRAVLAPRGRLLSDFQNTNRFRHMVPALPAQDREIADHPDLMSFAPPMIARVPPAHGAGDLRRLPHFRARELEGQPREVSLLSNEADLVLFAELVRPDRLLTLGTFEGA